MDEFKPQDVRYMKLAMDLGTRAAGLTEPNPTVGAVVVKNRRILATGFHRGYGEKHAEAEALNGVQVPGSTLYVPLEPCCHYGKNPPCADLIIEKRVRRVVISRQDPNPLVNGGGIRRLRSRGVRVDVGCLSRRYLELNRHYFTFITRNRPHVTVKAGMSLDGKLTDRNRNSRWITDGEMRAFSRSLRGEFSAILVGDQTVRDDDPRLTIRDREWSGKKLVRVVLDSRNRLDPGKRIFKNQKDSPLFIFSSESLQNQTTRTPHHYFVPADGDRLRLDRVLEILAANGISSLLVEGGGQVIDSFLTQGLVDEVVLFTAGKLLGGRDAVELFASGVPVSSPIQVCQPKILELQSGWIIRGRIESRCREE